ncbi:MAG: hypothetical protein AAFY19_07825 [Pseudomonadota bacterium]
MTDTIGIDIGGVIIKPAETKGDTSFFSDNYLATPMFEGVVEAICRLREDRFGENMHIVSKCGPNVQRKSLHWLEQHDFFGSTGLRQENVHFCRKRPEKAPICDRLGVTVFIDDRLDVLCHMHNVPTRIHFCGTQRARAKQGDGSFEYQRCLSWKEVADTLIAQ